MNVQKPVVPTMIKVSTKGQIVLPKAVRDRLNLQPGTKLVIEDTPDGVLIKRAPLFPPTTIEEVMGMLKYDGPTVTIEEMHEAIGEEVRARHARGRY